MSNKTSTSTWIPPSGRHEVQIGASLTRTLRARKGLPQQKRPNHIPDKEFFALRYNFKPSSMDLTRPATLNKTSSSKLVVEHPSTNPDEVHVFVGEETPAKDYLCVLIYDESTGGFTLEKVESTMSLNNDRRATSTSIGRSVASSSTTPSSSVPPDSSHRRQEEEESESDDLPLSVSVRPPVPVPAPKPTQQENAPPRKEKVKEVSIPKQRVPPSSKKAAGKRAAEPEDVDVEVLEFGQPPKRIKTTPELSLEFPGPSSSALALPGSQVPSVNNASDSEEDWDEVVAPQQEEQEQEAPPSPPAMDDGEREEMDEFDEFENLMNEQLGEPAEEEEDFLAAAVSPEPESRLTGPIMSLRQQAGEMSDEEFSSSDDSDED